MKPGLFSSNSILHFFKRGICYIFLFVFAAALVQCSNKENAAVDANAQTNSVMTEATLPPGKPALEDEVNIIAPVNTDPGMIGKDNATDGKTGLPKVDLSDPEILKRRFKSLLMFHADDTMQVNQSRLATLVLSKDQVTGKIKAEVLEESNSGKDEAVMMDTLVELGSKMKARLIPFGNSGLENCFTIEALGDDIQSFRGDRKKIIWQWKITPLKPGPQELKLSIQIIQKDEETVSLPARNIPVMIMVKPESTMAGISNFFEKYWQFLITAILIPVISAWVSSIIKNRQPKEKNPPKDPPAANLNSTVQHSAY